uniref:snRNA-activating protein complex subunit 4 n=1 Tax=Strigamia maritima TaxID=126957 RepID=T1JEV1_STRMM
MEETIINTKAIPNMSDTGFEGDFVGAITVEGILAMETSHDKCLLLNKVYQELISHTIERLEIILEENLQQQELIREGNLVKSYQSHLMEAFSSKSSKWLAIFRAPYFRNRGGFVQQPNADTKRKAATEHIDPYIKAPRKWTAEEKGTLRTAVSANASQLLLEPHLIRKQVLDEKKHSVGIEEKIEECKKAMENIKSMDDKCLFSDQAKEYDWLTISNVTFEGLRSPLECELMWKNHVSPHVNTKKWTTEEDEVLERLIKENCNDWDIVTSKLNTKRTALQCFERYKLKFSKELTDRTWTSEDDDTLRLVIEECRVGKYIPWHQVAYYCERTNQEVYKRWKFFLDPSIKHGKWTEEEDTCLVAGILRYGENFAKISTIITGRTNNQIRDRYQNCMRMSITNSPWSLAEDIRLLKLVDSIGPKWCEVVTHFPGRTHQMVLRRYHSLVLYKEKHGIDEICEEERPRTIERETNNKYRDKIYEKVMETLEKVPANKKSDFLDDLMAKFERDMKNCPKKRALPIRMEKTFGLEDKAFVEYFILTSNPVKTGRPFIQKKCEVSESVYNDEICRILQSFDGKINDDKKGPRIKNEYLGENAVKIEFPVYRSSLLAPCTSTLRTLRFFTLIRTRLSSVQDSVKIDPITPAIITAEVDEVEKWRPKYKKRPKKIKKPWVIGANVSRWKRQEEKNVQENSSENGVAKKKPGRKKPVSSKNKTDVKEAVQQEENITENGVTNNRRGRGRPF